MNKQRRMGMALGVGLLALSMGCTPRAGLLVNDTFINGRSVKYMLGPAKAQANAALVAIGAQKEENLADFVVRICDYDGQDKTTNCKDSTVVAFVVPGSIY